MNPFKTCIVYWILTLCLGIQCARNLVFSRACTVKMRIPVPPPTFVPVFQQLRKQHQSFVVLETNPFLNFLFLTTSEFCYKECLIIMIVVD